MLRGPRRIGRTYGAVITGEVGQAFSRASLPLGCYYAIACVVPLVNGGAAAGSAFAEHELFVTVVPPLIVGLFALGRALVRITLEGLARRDRSERAAVAR
jgi:hypothetical protein